MYFNCKQPLTASVFLNKLVGKTVACCNSYITGLLQNPIVEPVFKVFKQMLQRSAHDANTVTFVSVLSACSDNKSFKFGLQVHELLVKVDLVLDLLVGTALLDMYSKCGYWHRAYDVFKELLEIRSLIT
ncbi:putative tetratricopeptide-like helical domain superfamily [Helianthus annuus]|nr:putative tetratricopeptide-like helical domain superfamily [Helianthus annuus]